LRTVRHRKVKVTVGRFRLRSSARLSAGAHIIAGFLLDPAQQRDVS
jgi:hypothetical protein